MEENIKIAIDSENNKWINCKDIAVYLNYKDIHCAIKTHIDKINIKQLKYIDENYKRYGKNIQGHSLYTNKIGIRQLILKSRQLPSAIVNLAKKCDIDINILNDKIITKEQRELDKIYKVFKNEKMCFQYKIGKYKIDLYFKEYRLAIECDENDHNDRDEYYEKTREEYIKNKLKCKFIRFNPDDKDYDIFNLIGKIYKYIKNND